MTDNGTPSTLMSEDGPQVCKDDSTVYGDDTQVSQPGVTPGQGVGPPLPLGEKEAEFATRRQEVLSQMPVTAVEGFFQEKREEASAAYYRLDPVELFIPSLQRNERKVTDDQGFWSIASMYVQNLAPEIAKYIAGDRFDKVMQRLIGKEIPFSDIKDILEALHSAYEEGHISQMTNAERDEAAYRNALHTILGVEAAKLARFMSDAAPPNQGLRAEDLRGPIHLRLKAMEREFESLGAKRLTTIDSIREQLGLSSEAHLIQGP